MILEISNITRSEKNWKDVLKVAGQLYRYEFDNIVMVTAQRSPEKYPYGGATLGRKWEDM